MARPSCRVDVETRAPDLLRLLEEHPYRLVLLHLPSEGPGPGELLPRIRGEGRPCARSILILMAPPEALEEHRSWIGRGVNALFPSTADPRDLETGILRQLRVAPRLDTRLAARLKLRVRPTLLGQTLNLSESGAFLITRHPLPLGGAVGFELFLPREKVHVRGEACVVRRSVPGREKYDGYGLDFSSFEGDGRSCLVAFLNSRLQPGA